MTVERIKGDAATESAAQKSEPRTGFIGGVSAAIKKSFAKTKDGVEAPIYDAAVFVISFLFARCHVVFGAYPIAIGVIAVLPSRVWSAVLGSVTGALTLGKPGIIYSMISAIVAFLRIIISATDKKRADAGEPTLFRESLVLRMSVALIGGFIVAVYEILLNSLTLESALFGLSMILLPPAIALCLSGLFGKGISPSAIFVGRSEILSVKRFSAEEKNKMLYFRGSALFGIFLVSIALGAYELFGISAGFVVSALASLFAARRFGTLAGAAVGFVSSVGLSGTYTVAFTLAGLIAGALSSLGIIPSVLLAGTALSVWGGYVEGTLGFLSVFPEYAIAAAIAIPLFKRIRLERTAEEIESTEGVASDMVGTMALSYKSKYSGALDVLETSFSSISRLARDARERSTEITREEYRRLVTECIGRYFDTEGASIPGGEETRALFMGKCDTLIPILLSGRKLSREDFRTPVHLSLIAGGISEAINRAVGIVSEQMFHEKTRDTSAEDFEYVSKLINEARMYDYGEKSVNERLCRAAEEALAEMGIAGGAVQVFGERCPHFIVAIEDAEGSVISSPAFKRALEDKAGVALGTPEFYRKGRMALMECRADRLYTADSASAGAAMSDETSGDTARFFDTAEYKYYSLITDGMGSGEDAVRTSGFVADFLARTLEFGRGSETALRLLNNLVKRQRQECSATVDLFSFDLITGEATFHKCGAAPSYIRRGTSLFRIRSRTSPIGLSGELDAERIKAELEPGDLVIMFSDGVSADGEAPWLLDVISRPALSTPRSLADAILTAAKKHGTQNDDLSVLVTEIGKRKA